MNLIEQIKRCTTMAELDLLRLEIVKDKVNFKANQQAFIEKKKELS